MAVGIRIRTRSLGTQTGSFVGVSWPYTERTVSKGHLWMEDMTSSRPHPDQPMLARQSRIKVITMQGKRGLGNLARDFSAWPTDYQASFNFPATPTPVGAPSDSDVMLMHLARTNPGRPHVSLPVFLFELKDLPGMFLHEGEKLLGAEARKRMRAVNRRYGKPPPKRTHNGTGSTVEYYFGWEPLFRDLAKMLDFGAAANQRLKSLQKLNAKGGGRFTTVVANSSTETITTNVWIQSGFSVTIKGTKHVTVSLKRWASDRKTPRADTPKPTDQDMLDQAWRAVRGERLSFADAWEAFPWSWFVDWFIPIGDFLQAEDNSIPFDSTGQCVMCQLLVKETIVPTSATAGITCSGGGGEHKMMLRVLKNPFTNIPQFRLPFLNGKQLSILSSIAFSRMG